MEEQADAVLVAGALAVDTRWRLSAPPIPATSNHGAVVYDAGGCGRNVSENLARLGHPTMLLSTAGDDVFGRFARARTEQAGVDCQHVGTSAHPTPAYMGAMLPDGTLFLGMDDYAAVQELTVATVLQARPAFDTSRCVVLEANLPQGALDAAAQQTAQLGRLLCLLPVSASLARRVAPFASLAWCLVCSRLEAESLLDHRIETIAEAVSAAQQLLCGGPVHVAITLGEQGAAFATDGDHGHAPVQPASGRDSSGCGDAFAAALLSALLRGRRLREAVHFGNAAGRMTADCGANIVSHLTWSELIAAVPANHAEHRAPLGDRL